MIARRVGLAFLAAGVTGWLSLTFPLDRFGSRELAGVASTVAAVVGVLLLVGRVKGWRGASSWFVFAFATATVSLGVYAGGAPVSGAMFFYFWVVPYAFALFSRWRAGAQAGWMAVCYGVVLTIQAREHPAIGSAGDLAGLWFLAVVTVCAVGMLARTLSRSLRDVDRRFHRTFQESQIGAAFVSTDGRWLDVNDALCRMLGRRREELVGLPLVSITAPEDRDATDQAVASASRGLFEYEKRYLRPDGQPVWVAVSASLITPEVGPPYLFGQYRDITAHKQDRDALAFQAVHDPLTGLFNRTLLLDRLETALARREEVAVILLDLDGFKVVNDSLGHYTGDQVLTTIAPRLEAAAARTDTLARLGGDEFVVLCERINGPMDVLDRAARLAAAVREPLELASGRHSLSASIGVAVSDGHRDTPGALLRDADAAMYRAKARGRGQIELFDHSMRDEAIARLQLERDLQIAIEEHQFLLEYQPIVETDSLRPVAFEALIRWDHRTRGRLAPDSFIPLAEETGLIAQIGNWVINTACAQLATWQREIPGRAALQVAVNVSPAQLSIDGFPRQVANAIRRSRINPGSLWIEITETALVDDAAAATLAELKALGVKILLDDFGTGYSSLAHLARFPIDTVKIDRAFIAELDATNHAPAITNAILAIAKELKLDVVAEGVETHHHLEQLRALGCPHVQGQAVSYPLAPTDVLGYLAATRSRPRALALTA